MPFNSTQQNPEPQASESLEPPIWAEEQKCTEELSEQSLGQSTVWPSTHRSGYKHHRNQGWHSQEGFLEEVVLFSDPYHFYTQGS